MLNLRSSQFLISFLILLSSIFISQPGWSSEPDLQTFTPHESVSDGKHGAWHEWKQSVANRPVQSVIVRLRREEGGNDTWCNLGFQGGQNFQPMRMQIDSNSLHDVTWNAGGQQPNGRELVLKAYGGRVFVDTVTVRFVPTVDSQPALDRPNIVNSPSGNVDFERVISRAQKLDEKAEDAYYDIRDREDFRGDYDSIDSVRDFAREVHRFNANISSYRDSPDRLRDTVDDLASQAKRINKRINGNSFFSSRSFTPWNRVMDAVADLRDSVR